MPTATTTCQECDGRGYVEPNYILCDDGFALESPGYFCECEAGQQLEGSL